MCGRFSFATNKEKVQKDFKGIVIKTMPAPSYNIAPTQSACVITDKNPKALQPMRWGLIPHWAKNEKSSNNLINARSEGIMTKPSFRIPIRKKRCIVIADSFYEFKKQGTKKIPFRITNKNEKLLALGGIWDVWKSPSGIEIFSFSIITTAPNKEMETVHDRMPLILPTPEIQSKWLSDIDLDTTVSLMQKLPDGSLEMYRVSPAMNSPKFNSPECHKPHNPPLTLFDQL